MTRECFECGEEFEEGDHLILEEIHLAEIKDGFLNTGVNSLQQDNTYCAECWNKVK